MERISMLDDWMARVESGVVVWRSPSCGEPIVGRDWAPCSDTPVNNPEGMPAHAWEKRPGGLWLCPACKRATTGLELRCPDSEHKWGDDNRCTVCEVSVVELYKVTTPTRIG